MLTRADVAAIYEELGGSAVYTAPGGDPIPTHAIFEPKHQLLTEEGAVLIAEVSALKLQKADVPSPVRNATVIYTDPDTEEEISFMVDQIIGSDTHVTTVEVTRR